MRDAIRAEAERGGVVVAGLQGEFGPVDCAPIEARWGSGFQSASAEAQFLQGFAQQDGVGFAGASGGILLFAAVDQAVEECSGGDDDGLGADGASVAEFDAKYTVSSFRFRVSRGCFAIILCLSGNLKLDTRNLPCDQICDFGLLDFQVGLGFEDLAHFEAIGLLVALGAGRPDGGAAGSIQQSKLNADGVSDLAHDAAESIDFADQMTLRNASDGGIAGHLRDKIDVQSV